MITLPRTQVLAAVAIVGSAALLTSGLVTIPSSGSQAPSTRAASVTWTPNSLSVHRSASVGSLAIGTAPISGAHAAPAASTAAPLSGSHTQPIVVTAALLNAVAPTLAAGYLPAAHVRIPDVTGHYLPAYHTSLRGPIEAYLPSSHVAPAAS